MSKKVDTPSNVEPPKSFSEAGKARQDISIFKEFLLFLAHNKRWWMLPIFIIILAFGLLAFLSATGAAPFIYSLF